MRTAKTRTPDFASDPHHGVSSVFVCDLRLIAFD
jgi:hypothetical protein